MKIFNKTFNKLKYLKGELEYNQEQLLNKYSILEKIWLKLPLIILPSILVFCVFKTYFLPQIYQLLFIGFSAIIIIGFITYAITD